ncbi:(2,3-dihydroxybenzoyl)adenylate synthase [Streptomyces sp. ST2-7A]|uniref:(2,3-dihydroxybenzoyl)adenylate synthase n=1 Tax=Streptomyces sp. ST2-7A TaxID=2907214 RepID=UPI001F1761D9|nr:AMP-binding protein [Streptomyces sp. ST2-7A]MCE7079560.1 AMP-binding protein [Streptomyces sp. ST2-7A]
MNEFTPWSDEDAARYRAAGIWRGVPLGHALTEAALLLPARTAAVDRKRRITHGEVRAEADDIARGLLAQGVNPGDRVMVQLPNVVEFLTVTVGLFRAGVIPVFALPGHRESEVRHLIEASGAVGYVTADRFQGFDYRALARHAASLPGVRTVIVAGDSEDLTPLSWVRAQGADGGPLPEVDPSSVAFLLLSGGSTGKPKLIPRTHDDYLFNIAACAQALEFGAESVYLAANPAAHNAALGCPGVLGALLVGGKAVLTASPSPDEVFPLIEREGVTHTTVVPTLAALWSKVAAKRPVDMKGVLLQVGSSKFDEQAARRTQSALGCRITNWFGIGEGLLTYTRLDDPEEVVHGTEGRPLSEFDELRLVDDELHEVPAGAVGELVTRGPYTINGYWNAPEANRTSFTPDGFFRTGDLARLTPEGNLVVVGRAKDVINRGGEKVSADEIEGHLRGHEAIDDAAVVARPDAELGEAVLAFVVPGRGPGQAPSLMEIKRYLSGKGLAAFKLPDEVRELPVLPRTPVGKIDKVALRATAASG